MRRRVFLMAASAASAAWGQADWRRVPVPLVSPDGYLSALYRRWYAPQAAAFDVGARTLAATLTSHCAYGALADARDASIDAMTAWERLGAVAVGPLIERRTARRIDFTPTRPASVLRAAQDTPQDMARVGGPAKGLGALEWLLWKEPVTPGSATCRYAVRVADDIAAEATALAAAFAEPREWPADTQAVAFGGVVNQFVGGIEALRWGQIEKPLKEGRGRFPRALSGATAAAWQARWQALRVLAVDGPDAHNAPVSIEAYLRGRGLNPLADTLRAAVDRCDAALRGASPARSEELQSAARALDKLKRLVEFEVAPALKVSIGFTDSDGD
ncbi:imelysin family protein [Piscinibacter sp.]|uniref:imelysin family protein n=1 Tax=Piscinibacter sp. TaxID=1903157 RepID=UPI002C49D694|nr:imelysin family protein [Albitalea sp.]HUG24111.1 imelysin family protein [Albitalea sp.]